MQVLISSLSKLDFFVFFGLLALTFLAVFYGEWKKKKGLSEKESLLDLLLMGRQLTLPLFVANLVSTWYGGIFGVTQITFESGIYNFLTQGIFWYITYVIFALFLVPKLRRFEAMTLPDLVGQMFGPRSEKVSAIFNLFNILPVSYALSIGLLLQAILGGSLPLMVFCGTFIIIFYSLFGGLRAVVYSDLIQFGVMCSSVAIIFIAAMGHYGGLSYLTSRLPESHFSFLGGNSLATTLVWGFIALGTLVDPSFYQRVFAAKTEKIATRGILISTMIWVIFDICTTGGALYARAALPDAPSNQAYLIMAMNILPDGAKGFVLAGIFATIASTLDSFLFIASTTLVYDILPKRFRSKIFLHHMGLIVTGVIACTLAMAMEDGGIKQIWKTLGSYSAGCLLMPLLLGHMFPRKISDNLFVVSTLLGAIAITLWRNWERPAPWDQVDDLYTGLITTGISLLIGSLAKKLRPQPSSMQ